MFQIIWRKHSEELLYMFAS